MSWNIWKRLEALEERVKALEEREGPAVGGEAAGRLLQEGLDNIMAYQWPPQKGGDA